MGMRTCLLHLLTSFISIVIVYQVIPTFVLFPDSSLDVSLEKARQQVESLLYKIKSLEERTECNVDDSLKEMVVTLFENTPVFNQTRAQPTIIKNFIRRAKLVDTEDIVLATHLSPFKFDTLLIQTKYWKGPVSVAVHLTSREDIDLFWKRHEESRQILKEVTFHLVIENQSIGYPHNILRNVALEAIESDYFLALDLDLIPMPEGCHDRILSLLKQTPEMNEKLQSQTLFVLPAFELFTKKDETHANEERLPKSKEEVLNLIKRKEMSQFKVKRYSPGHASTRYKIWKNTTVATKENSFYDVNVSKKESLLYEPYVVGYKPGIPRYWEHFRSGGKNKISFFTECWRAGYKFSVLNNFYCVHLNHPHNTVGIPAQKGFWRKTNLKVFDSFLQYLDKKYGTEPIS